MRQALIIFTTVLLSGCFGWYEMPVWSMEPTIMHGAKVKIESDFYQSSPIERFDIVGYLRPDNDQLQVKRVVGLGGETIKIMDGIIYIDGLELNELVRLDLINHNFAEFLIPEGQYFLLGDNRNRSSDSRTWGPLGNRNITGKVVEIKNP